MWSISRARMIGELEYVEIKGVRTRDWLLKWKLFDALQPETRKRVV
jgi:hypothetical protein